MKLLFLSIAVFIGLSVTVVAQSNFKPAYVLKSNGDTVKGYINYREWNITPKNIEFKSTLGEKNVTIYQPTQITEFGINNMDKYLSYIGRISADDNIFPDLPSHIDTTTKNDTVFLQVVYKGKPLSLLSQRDKQKFRYFYQENSEFPVELKMHQYYVNATQLSTFNPYIEALQQLATKYNPTAKNINTKIEKAKFSESEFTQIVKTINSDKSKNTSGTLGTAFFAGVMLNRTTTQFEGINVFTGQKSSSYLPRVSLGFDFFTNRNTQRLVFRGELSFSMAKASFKLGTNNGSAIREYSFDQATASFSPQVLYSVFNTDKVKVYIGAGVSLNLSAYPKNELTIYTEPTPTVQKDYYALSAYWLSVPVRAGVVLNKKLDINLLYSLPNTYSNYIYFGVSSNIYGLGVNYRFGK